MSKEEKERNEAILKEMGFIKIAPSLYSNIHLGCMHLSRNFDMKEVAEEIFKRGALKKCEEIKKALMIKIA